MNRLNPDQVEQLKEIGAHLRQLRQEQSIPLEEVAALTLIRLTLLKALEEGQSDLLPEPVFVQGFIRRYGDVLGLDGVALAKTFPINSVPVEYDTPSQDLPTPRSRAIPVYVPLIVLAVAAAGGLFFLLNRPRSPEPVAQTQNASVAQRQKTVAKPVPSLTPKPTPTPAKPKASPPSVPIQVSASFQDRSWVRVIADGKTQFEGTLPKGTKKTWTAKKQLKLRAGNAGGVLISFNREQPKLLGALDDVEEVTFTPKQ